MTIRGVIRHPMKIQHTLRALLGCLCLLTTALHAQVPNLVSYQGRVAVGTPPVNFDGDGRFKFALVANRNTVQATATAVVTNGAVSSIIFTNVGAGYPGGFINVSITGGGGTGASAGAAANGSDGSLHLVFLNGGSGYTSAPTVAIDPPPTPNFVASFWSHDGFSYLGAAPFTEVRLPVVKGLYSVLLGDTSVTGMIQSIPASVWTNPDVRLRVWFNDGTNGFQLLTPDRRLAPNGYLPDGIVTSEKLADGGVTSTKLADSAVTSTKIATGAVAGSQLASGAACGESQRFQPERRSDRRDDPFGKRRRHESDQRRLRKARQGGLGRCVGAAGLGRAARGALSAYRGVDGQRNDRVGEDQWHRFQRRRALQSHDQQWDAGEPRRRPPRAVSTRQCGRAAR